MRTTRMQIQWFLAACLLVFLLTARVWADSGADIATLPDSAATVSATISVTTALGSDSDNDSDTVTAGGAGYVIVEPTNPDWTHARILDIYIAFGTVQLDFDLFCLPIIGCQDLDVTIENLALTSTEPFETDVASDGSVVFVGVSFHATGQAQVMGLNGIVDESFLIDNTNTGDFSGRITGDAGALTFDELATDPVDYNADPTDLPDGVTALSFTINMNLTNVIFTGTYAEVMYPAGDLDKDLNVGLTDFELFHACFAGPDSFIPPVGCDAEMFAAADFSLDGDVDVEDFGFFQTYMLSAD